MIRQFAFEADLYETLECLPMAVKRKLDRIALKIGRKQWTAMGQGERLAICHLPAESKEECETLRLFILEAVARQGTEPVSLPESVRQLSEPPREIPAAVAESARAVGFLIDQQKWTSLDADQRYALIKLIDAGKKRKRSRALAEFFPESTADAAKKAARKSDDIEDPR